MYALLSLVVCLVNQPVMCETVIPNYLHQDTGQPPSFFECLGVGGQDIARAWLDEHPGYLLRRITCSIGDDPTRLRDRVEAPRA
jgi:hypothetical protein